jgi:hypothetical protein
MATSRLGEVSDLELALQFAQQCFEEWRKLGLIGSEQYQPIVDVYERRRAGGESPGEPRANPFPNGLATEPTKRQLQLWQYVKRDLQRHRDKGRLHLAQADAFLAEANERIARPAAEASLRRNPRGAAGHARGRAGLPGGADDTPSGGPGRGPDPAARAAPAPPARPVCPGGRCWKSCSTHAAFTGCWPSAAR